MSRSSDHIEQEEVARDDAIEAGTSPEAGGLAGRVPHCLGISRGDMR
jgi:hypothetical protein